MLSVFFGRTQMTAEFWISQKHSEILARAFKASRMLTL